IYYDGDPFMGTAAESSKKRLAESGIPVVYAQTYNDTTPDFKPMLLRAKQSGAKALFFYGYDQMGTAMKEARDLGTTLPFFSLATLTSPGFQHLAGSALDGTVFPWWQAPRTAQFDEFQRRFAQKVGRAPYLEISTVPSYDIAQLIVNALSAGAL